MPEKQDRDVTARLAELEATVRGLTQELVSAEERIRQLEAAQEAAETPADPSTKDTPGGAEVESETPPEDDPDEAATDIDDIIVA